MGGAGIQFGMREEAGTQDEPRAGARILELLANPLNARILRALEPGPLRLAELHERTEWPAQTTLRAVIANLRELGLLERVEVNRMPLSVANGLTDAGREALFVAGVVERWLAAAPEGPIPIDSDAAKAAIKALTAAWSSTMVRELAFEPASLTELDRRIEDMSYPSLERRLSRMRSTRQIEPAATANGRGRPFGVTEWLRLAVAPLCASARCERRFMREESAPITAVEVEAAFLLVVPLIVLPAEAEGICMLSVSADPETAEAERNLAGVTVEVRGGEVVGCAPRVDTATPTWALGSPGTWLNVSIEGRLERLRIGGSRPQLAADLAHGIHVALFT